MLILGYVLNGLFGMLCVVGFGAMLWALAFAIRMAFQFQDKTSRYSRATLWNPMNAMLRPDLLSDAGRRSRKLAL